jgi:ATP-dependent DNA ligase
VAKDPESRYIPDRTLSWLKVRQRDYRKQRVVVDHEDESLRDTRAAA